MRSARANDYWRQSYNRNYTNYLKSIDLYGFNGIHNIELGKGISCITGLNGVGKSTIIAAVKAIIGLPIERRDRIRIGEKKFQGEFWLDDEKYLCKNEDGKNLFNQVDKTERFKYIDADQSIKILDYYLNQANIDELIEQNEAIDLNEEEKEEINYIIGREYEKITLYEINDIENFDTIPFFIITEAGIQYDSRKMGLGEHYLLYIFWVLMNTEENSFIIIEEPETFVGIKSQQGIMNIVAKYAVKEGCSFLITTHSPYILDRISDDNIKIIIRNSGMITVCNPSSERSVCAYLGFNDVIQGTLLVEDKMAEMFLECLLESDAPDLRKKYNVEIANSESGIKKNLEFLRTEKIKYRLIGVYDGDQKDKNTNDDKTKWPQTFLPVGQDVETEILKFLKKHENISSFAEKLNKDVATLTTALSMVSGRDKHDRVLDIIHYLSLDEKYFIRSFYDLWKMENSDSIDLFIKQIHDSYE